MSNVYKNYDISLIPTLYSEGTSLSCLEAQASGNVVIATNIGGLPNLIINNYNGILINPDKNELFKAIKRVVLDKDLRTKLSSMSRRNSIKKNGKIRGSMFSKNSFSSPFRQLHEVHLHTF